VVGQAPNLDSCAVCGRTILSGERVSEYVTGDARRVGVCALCKDRAEAAGWVPAALAGSARGGLQPRRRRSLELRQRFERYAERLRERRPLPPPRSPAAREAASERPSEPERPSPPPRPTTPEGAMLAAIDGFNRSRERRKVAGLIRSLGDPRVSVRAPSAVLRGPTLITVAWELSWYQWEVDADGEGGEVREVAKGSEIADLSEAQLRWNAAAGKDGALKLEGTGSAETPGGGG
jgi:hypothetical protein